MILTGYISDERPAVPIHSFASLWHLYYDFDLVGLETSGYAYDQATELRRVSKQTSQPVNVVKYYGNQSPGTFTEIPKFWIINHLRSAIHDQHPHRTTLIPSDSWLVSEVEYRSSVERTLLYQTHSKLRPACPGARCQLIVLDRSSFARPAGRCSTCREIARMRLRAHSVAA